MDKLHKQNETYINDEIIFWIYIKIKETIIFS